MNILQISKDRLYKTYDVIEFIYGERKPARRNNITHWRKTGRLVAKKRIERIDSKITYVYKGGDIVLFILKYPTVVPEERRGKVIEYLNDLVKE